MVQFCRIKMSNGGYCWFKTRLHKLFDVGQLFLQKFISLEKPTGSNISYVILKFHVLPPLLNFNNYKTLELSVLEVN